MLDALEEQVHIESQFPTKRHHFGNVQEGEFAIGCRQDTPQYGEGLVATNGMIEYQLGNVGMIVEGIQDSQNGYRGKVKRRSTCLCRK